MKIGICVALVASIAVLAAALSKVHADEGMWLFNNPPRKLLKDNHSFDPTNKWLEHVQKSSVRFNSGGSGAVVFGGGVVLTEQPGRPPSFGKKRGQEPNHLPGGV